MRVRAETNSQRYPRTLVGRFCLFWIRGMQSNFQHSEIYLSICNIEAHSKIFLPLERQSAFALTPPYRKFCTPIKKILLCRKRRRRHVKMEPLAENEIPRWGRRINTKDTSRNATSVRMKLQQCCLRLCGSLGLKITYALRDGSAISGFSEWYRLCLT